MERRAVVLISLDWLVVRRYLITILVQYVVLQYSSNSSNCALRLCPQFCPPVVSCYTHLKLHLQHRVSLGPISYALYFGGGPQMEGEWQDKKSVRTSRSSFILKPHESPAARNK